MRTYDQLSRSEIESVQRAKFQRLVERLRDHPYYADKLANLPDTVRLGDIGRIPFSHKAEYLEDQNAAPPYGRRLAVDRQDVATAHMTGGTSGKGREVHGLVWRDVEAAGHLSSFAFRWAGLKFKEPAAFHIGMSNATGGNAMLRGIQTLGAVPTLVAHLGFRERLRHLMQFPVVGMFATPSAINGLAMTARELDIDLKSAFSSLRFLLTAAEPYPVEWARSMESEWGAELFEDYGATQTASAISAATCERGAVVDGRRGVLHFFDWSFLVEVLDPETGERVPVGEYGELVVTTLDKVASPVLRYKMKDRVRFMGTNVCPCGRQLTSIECGSISRYDDMLKVKGQNVFPAEMEALIFGRGDVREFRGTVRIDSRGRDDLLLEIAPSSSSSQGDLAEQLAERFRAEFSITPTVRLVSASDLPEWSTPEAKARRFVDERYDSLRAGGSG